MTSNEFDHLPLDGFMAAAVGMAVLDPDTARYLRVNPALCRMLRREEVDLLERSHEQLTHPDDRPGFRERAAQLLSRDIDWWQVEKQLEAGDGSWVWVRSSGSLIHDAHGRPYFFTQYQDLTERRRAERALLHSEVRLHSAVADAPVVLFTLDTEGKVTFAEGGGVAPLTPPTPSRGISVFDAYPDAPDVERNVRRALAGERFNAVVEVRGVVFDTHYAPLTDDRGEIVGVVGAAVDATERVRAAREVERREERQAAIAALGTLALEDAGHHAVLELAVESVARCLDVDCCAILELGDDGELALRAGQGLDPDSSGDRELFQRVLRGGETEVLEASGRTLAAVCIGLPDGPAGLLVVAAEGRDFAVNEIGFLESVAHTVASSAARRRHEDEIRHRSLHDALTGLPNRTLLTDRIEHALAEARREGTEVALMLLDLDDFKDINDTLGHETGDVVLRVLSGRLAQGLRESDTVARLGGDEFAAVVPLADGRAGATDVAHKLLEAIDRPVEIGGTRLHLAASVGVAVSAARSDDTGSLLRQADVAMYQAKRSGGGVAFFDPSQEPTSMRYLAAAGQLREGIERGELVVHYQPCLLLDAGEVTGMEALVRWQHPDQGLLPPDRFIPLAERTGLIEPLTGYVLAEAMRERERVAELGHDLDLAVNLSARSFEGEGLEQLVLEAIAESGGRSDQLRLEITESAVLRDHERVNEVIEHLSAHGVLFQLDDFGTGHSSLSQLERLQVHGVKIDRSFTARLDNERATDLMGSIIELLKKLGVNVLAEGVETEQQRRCLIELGCGLGQGFLLARPMAGEQLRAWLAGRA